MNDQRCVYASHGCVFKLLACLQLRMQTEPYIVAADADTDNQTRMCPSEVINCEMCIRNEC